MQILGVVLAAGGGTRFHGVDHKLLTHLDGRPLWHHAVDAAAAALDDVAVVTGAVTLGDYTAPTDRGGDCGDQGGDQGGGEEGGGGGGDAAVGVVRLVSNAGWERGQASSLHAVLQDPLTSGFDAVVVGLADQPGIPASAWRAVADAPPSAPIVVATYGGRRGPHPVRLHRDIWPLLPYAGDAVAKAVIADHPDWVTEVACLGSVDDIDTVEDLARWRS